MYQAGGEGSNFFLVRAIRRSTPISRTYVRFVVDLLFHADIVVSSLGKGHATKV